MHVDWLHPLEAEKNCLRYIVINTINMCIGNHGQNVDGKVQSHLLACK